MVLPMTRPFKHPVTGIFYFRKRVPKGLQRPLGKGEIKISLGTRDFQEAKRRHAEIATEVGAEWERLRQLLARAPVVVREYSERELRQEGINQFVEKARGCIHPAWQVPIPGEPLPYA